MTMITFTTITIIIVTVFIWANSYRLQLDQQCIDSLVRACRELYFYCMMETVSHINHTLVLVWCELTACMQLCCYDAPLHPYGFCTAEHRMLTGPLCTLDTFSCWWGAHIKRAYAVWKYFWLHLFTKLCERKLWLDDDTVCGQELKCMECLEISFQSEKSTRLKSLFVVFYYFNSLH